MRSDLVTSLGVSTSAGGPWCTASGRMRSLCTAALVASVLLPGAAAAWATAPRRLEIHALLRPLPRPLEMRVAARALSVQAANKPGNHALRVLPVPVERPGPY